MNEFSFIPRQEDKLPKRLIAGGIVFAVTLVFGILYGGSFILP